MNTYKFIFIAFGLRVNSICIEARCQKRTAGIWWTTSRTVTYDFDISYTTGYYPNNKYHKIKMSGTRKDNKIRRTEIYSGRSIQITRYNCWATTPSIDYAHAMIYCEGQ